MLPSNVFTTTRGVDEVVKLRSVVSTAEIGPPQAERHSTARRPGTDRGRNMVDSQGARGGPGLARPGARTWEAPEAPGSVTRPGTKRSDRCRFAVMRTSVPTIWH